ncbi:endonuclease [Candidatus Symbiothrix dinenymphae]|nr:endonuclease [Candidatus Symbiothrix dinenymphae]
MKKTLMFSLLVVLFCFGCTQQNARQLRVMSFNIWVGGGHSIARTAAVIVESGADIVGIQEPNRGNFKTAIHIADSLGWYSHESGAILSKYPITEVSKSGRGVKIDIGNHKYVWVFNVHLRYCPYEPYQLNGKKYCGASLLQTADEAVASAWASRGEVILGCIDEITAAKQDKIPVFLTGDFNEPSCLDWTERAVTAGLCKMPVAWPATKNLQEKAGMKDSYRTVYPDEVKNPGHTWTSLPVNDIMDRIDFVFFGGDGVQVVNSEIIGEISPKSDKGMEEYPSDHRAVLSTFMLK